MWTPAISTLGSLRGDTVINRHTRSTQSPKRVSGAVRCEKEIRCFLVHPDAKWPEGFKDHGVARRRIAALRSELEAKYVVAYFVSPADLSGKVATTLAAWNQPLRTPLDVERKNRLMRTLLGAQTSRERNVLACAPSYG